MSSVASPEPTTDHAGAGLGSTCPLSLVMTPLSRMLNCEFADDPVYDGLELQWFDDATHGTGMLAFLSRRADRRVDYYVQRGLRLDPTRYHIGGCTGWWNEIDFEVARLEVAEDGVDAEVRFLLLVWMPGFDLVRVTGTDPLIRIDGRVASAGRLPGTRLHRRHLIKYAAPLVAVEFNRAHGGPVPQAAKGVLGDVAVVVTRATWPRDPQR